MAPIVNLNNPGSFFSLSNILILAGAGGGLLILASLVALFYCTRKRKKRNAEKSNVNDTYTVSSSLRTNLNTTTATGHVVSTTTLINDSTILAIPGYMEIRAGDITPERLIGEGGMAKIHLCKIRGLELLQNANGNQLCVAKTMRSDITAIQNFTACFNQEVTIMQYLGAHKNMARLLGFMQEPPTIVMRYYPNGSLSDFIYRGLNGISYNTWTVFNIIHGISSGLDFMHIRGVAHCDIKPANVLLETVQSPRGSFVRPLLSDFGISRFVTTKNAAAGFQFVNLNGASIRYAAPELIATFRKLVPEPRDATIVFKADIFALSAVVCELLTRTQPWSQKNDNIELI